MSKARILSLGLAAMMLSSITVIDRVEAGFAEGVKAYEAKEYKLAFEEWLSLARNNDPAAMRNIGHMYRRGLGVAQDYKQALTWYKRAATIGFDRAQANVAGMYLNGEGVEQDYPLAASWFARAAQQGHVIAQYNLGLMFENGLGVAEDETQAMGWFSLAAKAGHPQAMDKVSELEARGAKTPEAASSVAVMKPASPAKVEPAPPAKPALPSEQVASVVPEESTKDVTTDNEISETEPLQKKGFFETLKSLVVTQAPTTAAEMQSKEPEEALKVTTSSTPAPEALSKAETSKAAPSEAVKTPVAAKPAEKIALVTPTPVVPPVVNPPAVKPTEVIVVAVASKPEPTEIIAPSNTGVGLTIDERLEMADLSFTLQQYQAALGIWAGLAADGNAEAQYKLGTLFNNGLAVPVDRVRAFYWWEKAKENGSLEAVPALAGLEKSLTHMEKRQIQRTN